MQLIMRAIPVNKALRVWNRTHLQNTCLCVSPGECVCVRACVCVSIYLDTWVGPVVVKTPLPGDASSGATLTLVPEAHASLLGLLKDLDLWYSHCREPGMVEDRPLIMNLFA